MTEYENMRLSRLSRLRARTITTILLLGLVPAAAFVATAGATVSLNTLDVTIQTSQNLPFQYTLTAYNTSGYQVGSFYGQFPEAAFGLPTGTYLITASASYYPTYPCNPCPLVAKAGAVSDMPIRYNPGDSEYGYAVVKVSGPSQVNIVTKNVTQTSLVNVPVHVHFLNGDPAVGASVSAYVVGGGYGYSQQWVMYGQTGSDGTFTLTVPSLPVQVNAYLSYPIQLPKNISVVTVDVGGQKVNVTVYWPQTVGLFGQALVLPPQNSADITLHVQQTYPIYYANGAGGATGTPVPYGATTVTTTVGATGGKPAASPASGGNIAPFSGNDAQVLSPSSQSGGGLGLATVEEIVVGVGALALVGVGVVLLALSRRKNAATSARP